MIHQPKRYYRTMTRQKADEIRRLYFHERIKQKVIGEMFGIRQSSVSRIVSGMVWN